MYYVSTFILLVCLLSLSLAQQKYEFEFSSPQRKCPDDEKIAVGDRVTVIADGFLKDGTQFYHNDTIEFKVGAAGSRVPKAWHRTLKGQCLAQKVIMVIPPRLGYEQGRPSEVPKDATIWHIVIITSIVRIPMLLRSANLAKFSKIAQFVRNPQNCIDEDQVKIGDRLIVHTQGFREDQTVFSDGDFNFVLGFDKDVLPAWERGLTGKCVGEVVEIVNPGDRGSEAIVSVVRINAIIRDCQVGVMPCRLLENNAGGQHCTDESKVKQNLYIDLAIKAKIIEPGKPSIDGKMFFEKSSYQSRFGEDKTGVKRGIEDGLNGACEGAMRLVLIGPKLGYGHEGNKAYRNNRRGAVAPGTAIRIEAQINHVKNKKF